MLAAPTFLPATQTYVDAVGGTNGNTYNNATNSKTDWLTTTNPATSNFSDQKWGFRNSGQAAVAYGDTDYELGGSETNIVLRTEVAGLTPNTSYSGIRVYMVGRAQNDATNNWPIEASIDGTNWLTLIDFDATGYAGNLVDDGNNGVGVLQSSTSANEKRIWYPLPNATTDAAGVLKIYIRRPANGASRSVYDGIGYDNTALASADPYSNSVYVSEFMAANPGAVVLPGSTNDMDDDTSDWIELHNWGDVPANLSGWKLTDDPAVAGKWTFPSGTVLNAGARLVVFASGKNRQTNGVEFHTNFKLAASGFLQLSRPAPSGPDVVLSVFGSAATGYATQNSRASYGSATVPPAALAYGYFPTPTPGSANNATNYPDFVKSPSTDIDRGMFTTPFTVTLTCATAGSTILYTLDGTGPVEGASNTTAILPANASTTPSGTVSVTGTTILRTRSIKTGFAPSKVDSHTYLFPAQVLTQTAPPAFFPTAAPWSHYGTADWAMDPNIVNHADPENRCTTDDLLSIPSVSLVMDWSELFGASGIYPAISPVPQEGLDKAANIELLNPNGSRTDPNAGDEFTASGRTHIFGGTSQQRWKVDKLSFNFNVTGTVSSDVFGDTGSGAYGRFILDARMGNTWLHATDDVQRTHGDYIRDEVAAEAQRLMGYAATHTRRVHLYLNGLYWGLYTLHEKPDQEFQASYQGGDPDDWDVLKHSPLRDDCLGGGTFVNPALPATTKTNNTAYVNYQAMLATLATGVDLTNSSNYAAVGAKLDIDAFIDYMVMNFALNNFDWSHQNWYASYHRTGSDGRWRFHSWDAEHVLRYDYEEIIAAGNSGTGSNALLTNCNQSSTPTYIHQRLATNGEYRMRFADRIHKWCFNNGLLTVGGVTAICDRQFNEIDAAMRCESARWGDNRAPVRAAPYTGVTYTRGAEWIAEKNRMLNTVVAGRFGVFLNSMKSKTNALYPRVDPADTASAIFYAPSYAQHGGRVPNGYTLAIGNPNGALGTIYYTLDGSDPRLTGGALNGTALAYGAPVSLSGTVVVKSRVLNGTVWSALDEATFSVGTVAPAPANLVVSKIMWKPANPTDDDILAGFTDDSDFEFLELYNPSSSPVDLTGIDFSAGLDLAVTASAPTLAPGGRAAFAAKPSAFIRRYGSSVPLFGKFINGSNLSSSEKLTLIDASGTALSSFTYNATATGPWPKNETSGTGAALVLIRPETIPNPNLGVSWRASLVSNPSPGVDDRPNLSAWQLAHFQGPTDLTADADGDGLPNLVEFALGLDPMGPDEPARQPLAYVEAGPNPTLVLVFRRLKFLENFSWQVEHAAGLAGPWSTTSGPVVLDSTIDEGDGTETVIYRCPLTGGTPDRFFRLRVTEL